MSPIMKPPLVVRFDSNPPSIQRIATGIQTGAGTVGLSYPLLSLPLYLVEKLADFVRTASHERSGESPGDHP
jgi:uncharacterized protein